MKTILVVTKDVIKGEAITQPTPFRNIAEAKRSWAKSIEAIAENNPDKIPITDYQLHCLGTFDTETLVIESKPEFIANASEFIK